MERDIWKVIDQIEKEIPANFEGRTGLIKALNKVWSDALYHAPEIRQLDWRALAEVLTEHLKGFHKTSWAIEISDIMTDKKRIEILFRKF